MFAITNDRKSLWQWDLNQQLTVAGDCTEVHYLDRGAPSTLTVDVKDGKADIPNILLQKAGRLVVYAYIIDAQDHHTKVCETFGIAPRPKPAEYVYTETEVKTWSDLQSQIGDLDNLVTEEKNNLVAAINEAAKSGGESYTLPQATAEALGGVKADSAEAADTQPVRIGGDGKLYTAPGGKTPNITIGNVETLEAGQNATAIITGESPDLTLNLGIPKGADGQPGTDGKTAYQYAQEGGYTGTETEFAEKLASELLIVTITDSNGTLSADKSYNDIYNAIIAGTSVIVNYGGTGLPLIVITADVLYFGAIQCANADDSNDAAVGTIIIEITQYGEVNDISAQIDIPKTLPNPNALTFTGAVTGRYDGSTAVSVEIPSGGSDISLGLTSASVGQIIKVKAIDASGKPTAWEAAYMPSGGGGASYRSWSKVWTLAVAEDIAGFEANNIDLDGKSEIMIVFISDSTASRTMTNGRIYINGVDAGKVLFNSLPLRKDSHSFVIIGRADEGIEYTTMAAKAEYQTYPWQGDVNVVHRMVSGTASSIMQWTAGSTIKITQASATLGQGVTIEIYVR